MKTLSRLSATLAALATATFGTLSAATHYVSLDSPNPTPPFTNWATATHVIQDAVDAAKAGDTVLVTNGVYATGNREVSVLDTNAEPPQLVSIGLSRVVVTNAIRLESVNGPQVTTIEGSQLRDQSGNLTNGVRCVLLATNAVLSGFTLTNGCAGDGGGVWCASTDVTLTNCIIVGNSAHFELNGNGELIIGAGGGTYSGTLWNCTVRGNSALCAGGVVSSILYDCALTGNSSGGWGGGATDSTLYNCTLSGNVCRGDGGGGGACGCTLYNCVLNDNSADFGGGVSASKRSGGSTLYNCTLTGNSAGRGGGAYWKTTLYNCKVVGNSAFFSGGGVEGSTLYNCTLTGNFAEYFGEETGGASGSTLYNSIIYYNSGNYDEGTTLNYCCTFPMPSNGIGNITGPPLFMDLTAGDFRLREDSPCIDAGTNLVGYSVAFTNADTGLVWILAYAYDPTDILGNTRFIDGNGDGRVAWDIGAYEFNSFRPPRFSIAPQRTPEGWTLNVTGAANQWVHLQRSSNLKDWEDLWSGWMGAEGVQQVNDRVSYDEGQTVMFYRVVVP